MESENRERELREQMEVRIVALLMGETSAFETDELQEAMKKDPSLAAFHDEMRRTIDLVQEASKMPAGTQAATEEPKLSEERREALLSKFREKEVIELPMVKFNWTVINRWLVWGSAAAIVLLLAAMMLPALSKAKAKAQRMSAINNLKESQLALRWDVRSAPEASTPAPENIELFNAPAKTEATKSAGIPMGVNTAPSGNMVVAYDAEPAKLTPPPVAPPKIFMPGRDSDGDGGGAIAGGDLFADVRTTGKASALTDAAQEAKLKDGLAISHRLETTRGNHEAKAGADPAAAAPSIVSANRNVAEGIQAGTDLAMNGRNETRGLGVEMAPLPVQLPLPTLKGTPDDLPSGPHIEPLTSRYATASPGGGSGGGGGAGGAAVVGRTDLQPKTPAPAPAASEPAQTEAHIKLNGVASFESKQALFATTADAPNMSPKPGGSPAASMVINETMYAAEAQKKNQSIEWTELANPSDKPITLGNYAYNISGAKADEKLAKAGNLSVELKQDGSAIVTPAKPVVNGWQHNMSAGYTTAQPESPKAGLGAIAAGAQHQLALQADGNVLAWGADGTAQLPPQNKVVEAVNGTYRNSLALDEDRARRSGEIVVPTDAQKFYRMRKDGEAPQAVPTSRTAIREQDEEKLARTLTDLGGEAESLEKGRAVNNPHSDLAEGNAFKFKAGTFRDGLDVSGLSSMAAAPSTPAALVAPPPAKPSVVVADEKPKVTIESRFATADDKTWNILFGDSAAGGGNPKPSAAASTPATPPAAAPAPMFGWAATTKGFYDDNYRTKESLAELGDKLADSADKSLRLNAGKIGGNGTIMKEGESTALAGGSRAGGGNYFVGAIFDKPLSSSAKGAKLPSLDLLGSAKSPEAKGETTASGNVSMITNGYMPPTSTPAAIVESKPKTAISGDAADFEDSGALQEYMKTNRGGVYSVNIAGYVNTSDGRRFKGEVPTDVKDLDAIVAVTNAVSGFQGNVAVLGNDYIALPKVELADGSKQQTLGEELRQQAAEKDKKKLVQELAKVSNELKAEVKDQRKLEVGSPTDTVGKSMGVSTAGRSSFASRMEQRVEKAVRKPAGPPPTPQPEIATRDNAFSTFSLNVSDVSFKLAASSLESGALPDPASVRVEEFLNAFNYRDPAPAPGARLAFAWERARYPFGHNRDLLRFSVQTAARGREAQKPLNLVLLMDCSGSMERPDRVEIMHQALKVLADKLQPQDKISVVAFARTARLLVDGLPGGKKKEFLDKVMDINPEGGTNLEEAMKLAYLTAARHFMAQGMNRVILLTDGAANLGNVEPEVLKERVVAHRAKGIALDCFGIGWEGYNDDLLEILSRNGDGRYGFLDRPEQAAPDFANQLAGALNVAAADVKTQVEFNPERVQSWRQIGYAKHQLTKQQFRDNSVDAAEIAASEAGNALYVVQANPDGNGPIGVVRVRYKVPDTGEYVEQEWTIPYQPKVAAMDQGSPAMRLACASAAFGEWLSQSPYAAEVKLAELQRYLSDVPRAFAPDPRPQQLVTMIRQAQDLSGQ